MAEDAEDQDCDTFLTMLYKRKIRLSAAEESSSASTELENTCQFSDAEYKQLNELFSGKCLSEDLKRKIIAHFPSLEDEFLRYFPDVEPQNPISKLVRNPFLVNIENLPHDLQEEAIE
ncbi:conserved hypothetical protein [Trichinella spiralis]|uniref:hypothetical protein n=1 Tax=Trichinella spiralis TaxID=6334 RepID=UPI0001EFB4D2|nr:conserved hypothetical protein [Trichinella spiralis]